MNILIIGTPGDNTLLKEAATFFNLPVILDTAETFIQAKALKNKKNYEACIVSSGIIIHSDSHDFLNSTIMTSRKSPMQVFVLTEFKGEELHFREKELIQMDFIPWGNDFNLIPHMFSQIIKKIERKCNGIYTPNQ